MDFYELVDRVANLLQQRGKLIYRSLRRQFDLDDGALDDLKEEPFYAYPVVDDESRGLVWTGETIAVSEPPVTAMQFAQSVAASEVETARAEPPRSEPPTSDAECRQLTVMFCDRTSGGW